MKIDTIFNYLFVYPLYIIWRIIWRIIKIDKISIILTIILTIYGSFFHAVYYVPSPSMMPTLLNRDFILASKLDYGYNENSFYFAQFWPKSLRWRGEIKRGDIAVFMHDNFKGALIIKRIIGLPGDKIKFHKGRLYINEELIKLDILQKNVTFDERDIGESRNKLITGNILQEYLPGKDHQILKHMSIRDNIYDFADMPLELTIPEDKYFVLGDNRDSSADSRSGFLVERDKIIAKAKAIVFSTRAKIYEPWKYISGFRYSRLGWIN